MQKERLNGFLYIGLLIPTWILLLLTFFFNGISSVDASTLKWGIFQSTTGNISDEFYVEITPAGWTFSIWGFIYAYQVIWMLYATANIFRKSADGVPLYKIAPFIHWGIFVSYIVNLILNISWLLLWDRKHLVVAFIVLLSTAFTTYACGGLSVWGIFKYNDCLVENGFRFENRFVLGFVTNAFAIYGTWVSVATLLNFSMVLVYVSGMTTASGSTIALCLLTFVIMVWALLDLAFLEKYTRFVFLPHLVLITALSGSISKNYNATKPNSIYTVFLLTVVLVMLIAKIIFVAIRETKDPSFKDKSVVKIVPE